MAFFLIGGLFAGMQLTSQVFPTIDPRMISITVSYPGANPFEVEDSITRRIEESLVGLDGVDRVVSTASENMGSIVVELKDFVDADKVRDDVETAVEQIIDFPPEDAEQVKITKVESLSIVMSIVVSSTGDEMDTRLAADQVREHLRNLPSVSLVDLQGAKNYEIAIEVSEDALRRYELTFDQISMAIRRSSLNLSSGELRTEAGDLLLRTEQKRYRGEEFNDIVVRAMPDGTVLKLGDIARITDSFEDVDLINEYNGRPAIFVRILKSEAEDTLAMSEEIYEFLDRFEPPDGVRIDILQDESSILSQRLNLLVRNGVLGFALVVTFLVLMLDLRLAIWVAMGVPISFLGAFLFFDLLGVNYNMVSLFALIIVLGIVVDDAIVVGENIGREQELGKVGVEAALAGVRGVFSPVFIGVLTTMSAFAPLLLATGTFGQILGTVPVVVITVLTISLIEVFLILPAHLSHEGKWSRRPLSDVEGWFKTGLIWVRDKVFMRGVTRAIEHPYLTLLISVIFLAVPILMLTTGIVRFIFFPTLESDSVSAEIVFPVGTPFDVTEEAAEKVYRAALQVNADTDNKAFAAISRSIGGRLQTGGGPDATGGFNQATHIASIQVQLNPEPLNTLSAVEIERLWRNQTGLIHGVESLTFSGGFIAGSSSVSFDLSHPDSDTLVQAVQLLMGEFRRIEGLRDIRNSFNPGKRQFDIELTDAGVAAGLSTADVARQLRQSFFGETVQRIQRGRDEVKVMLRLPGEERSRTSDLSNTRIRLSEGTEVPFFTVARTVESRGYSSIERVDGYRVVTISGTVDIDVKTPNEVIAELNETAIPKLEEQFPGVEIEPTGFSQQQAEDLASLGQLTMLALLIIFILLASQLRSYSLPFIILAAIPFGAGGAIIGHYLLGYTLSFVSLFGIIALSGVVVNGSLVLVDLYRRLRTEQGFSVRDAILNATQRRFRAIILTTATTSLGLTPMLFEKSIQAQFLIPLAVSLAIGILFGSLIILFIVPSLLMIRERVFNRVGIDIVGELVESGDVESGKVLDQSAAALAGGSIEDRT